MKITVEEIARLAGVSKATVSRVLNNSPTGVGKKTRERVEKIIRDTNYSTNNNVKEKSEMKSKSIALVLPDLTNPFFSEIAKAIESRAKKDDYIVFIVNTDFSEENEVKAITSLLTKKLDGIILISSCSVAQDVHFLPKKYNIPLILLDRKLEGLSDHIGVYSDNEYAAFTSCEALIKNGSNRIAFISGPLGASTSKERLEGYKVALKQYNIEGNDELIKFGNYTVESGYEAVLSLERYGVRYSAILAANDMMALGAIRALTELSYNIPNDIEVIGFDNISFSQYCEPPLSTIQQPTVEMGVKATETLLRIIIGETGIESTRLYPKLLLRRTTKRGVE